MVPAQQFMLLFIFKFLSMKVYLVSTSASVMVGIEQCRLIIVPAAREAAFLHQYAGRILIAGCSIAAWPSVPVSKYRQRRSSPPGGRQRSLTYLPVTYSI
jgi:hypothetical protein